MAHAKRASARRRAALDSVYKGSRNSGSWVGPSKLSSAVVGSALPDGASSTEDVAGSAAGGERMSAHAVGAIRQKNAQQLPELSQWEALSSSTNLGA